MVNVVQLFPNHGRMVAPVNGAAPQLEIYQTHKTGLVSIDAIVPPAVAHFMLRMMERMGGVKMKKPMQDFNLGDTLRDTVSGFTGMATSKHQYLNGCVMAGLHAPFVGKDGMPMESPMFDVQQLELITKGERGEIPPIGGPKRPAPRGRAVPRR